MMTDPTRWTLMWSGPTRTYVLTEQMLVQGHWVPRTRSSWKTMPEALLHIQKTNDDRWQERV